MDLTSEDLPDIIAELESDPVAKLHWERAQLKVLTRKQGKLIAELRSTAAPEPANGE